MPGPSRLLWLALILLAACARTAPVQSVPGRFVTCDGQSHAAPPPFPIVERPGTGDTLVVHVLDENGPLPGAEVVVDGRRAVSGLDGVARVRAGRRLLVRYVSFWGVKTELRPGTRQIVVKLREQTVASCD